MVEVNEGSGSRQWWRLMVVVVDGVKVVKVVKVVVVGGRGSGGGCKW